MLSILDCDWMQNSSLNLNEKKHIYTRKITHVKHQELFKNQPIKFEDCFALSETVFIPIFIFHLELYDYLELFHVFMYFTYVNTSNF